MIVKKNHSFSSLFVLVAFPCGPRLCLKGVLHVEEDQKVQMTAEAAQTLLALRGC